MSTLAFELLHRFLWGGLLVLTLVSRRDSSERFPRIASYIGFGTALFAAYFAFHSSHLQKERILSLGLLILGSFLYSFTLSRLSRSLGFFLMLLSPLFLWIKMDAFGIFNFLSSALLLGSVYASQYLGHWFLTVPNLPLRDFQKVVKLIFLGLILKTVDVGTTLVFYNSYESKSFVDEMGRSKGVDLKKSRALEEVSSMEATLGVHGESYFHMGFFGLLILSARILWGLVAPFILFFMIKKTVDIRATQSATGILYALSVMLIIGEGSALYLNSILIGWHL